MDLHNVSCAHLCFNDGYLEKDAIMTCLVGRQGLEGLGTWMLEVGVGLNTEGDVGLRWGLRRDQLPLYLRTTVYTVDE